MPVLCKNTDLRCELLVIFFIDMYYRRRWLLSAYGC